MSYLSISPSAQNFTKMVILPDVLFFAQVIEDQLLLVELKLGRFLHLHKVLRLEGGRSLD